MNPDEKELLEQLVKDMGQVRQAIVGNPEIGHDGLVKQLDTEREHRRDGDKRLHEKHDSLDKRVTVIEKWKDRTIWTLVGIGFGSSAGGAGFGYWLARALGS